MAAVAKLTGQEEDGADAPAAAAAWEQHVHTLTSSSYINVAAERHI